MKKHLDDVLKNLPINKKWLPVVRGIAFVIGSIGTSTICYNIGKVLAAKLKVVNEKSQLEQQQQHEQIVKMFQDKKQSDHFASKSLAYSA